MSKQVTRKKLLGLTLAISLAMASLSGCGNSGNDAEDKKIEESDSKEKKSRSDSNSVAETETVSNKAGEAGKVSILELKQKYGTADTNEIKPFYNVEQNTEFTFHFNSKVEPCKAITVHTDPKCNVNSMVLQFNIGYKTENGMDVVVKPYQPVLSTDDRTGTSDDESGIWGYAPIYYLCIRYDMDATTPTQLSSPVIIPFTVKSTVSVPTLKANVDSNGIFTLTWNEVPGAVKYNIYSSFHNEFADNIIDFEGNKASEFTRSELGYQGDHLEKIATVTETSFSDFQVESSFRNDAGSNLSVDNYGDVGVQNFYDLNNYFVTAVDSSGNESFYSFPVSGWKYESSLPHKITSDAFSSYEIDVTYESLDGELRTFKSNKLSMLPNTVPVEFCDGSQADMPVNYELISQDYGVATYRYRVQGTMLSGRVEYENEQQNYPQTVQSTASVPYGRYEVENNILLVPTNDISTIIGQEYTGTGNVVHDDNAKYYMKEEKVYQRLDLEAARMINDGVYTENPFTYVDTYLATEVEPTVAENIEETQENNIVDAQIESTDDQVEEGNTLEVQTYGYPVFADSAEEEYLALAMIDRQESIDLSMFPSLQSINYLWDVIEKVACQNPYAISPESYEYDFETQTLYINYSFNKEETVQRQQAIYEAVQTITSSTIQDGMTDEQKINALWNYLEANTSYDNSVLELFEQNGGTLRADQARGKADAFNAYGILCNNVGVCQSYANAFKALAYEVGLDTETLFGYLDKTMPHAWNAVKLNGSWYWIDTTNNLNNAGIPYMLYQTSSDFAEQASYTLDNEYELDTNLALVLNSDNSKDWWYQNNLVITDASSFNTLVKQGVEQITNGSTAEFVVKYNASLDQQTLEQEFSRALTELYNNGAGIPIEKLERIALGQSYGYMLIVDAYEYGLTE